jgi:hypothetical protein
VGERSRLSQWRPLSARDFKRRRCIYQGLRGVTGGLPSLVARGHRCRCARDGACLSQPGWLIYMVKRIGHVLHRPQNALTEPAEIGLSSCLQVRAGGSADGFSSSGGIGSGIASPSTARPRGSGRRPSEPPSRESSQTWGRSASRISNSSAAPAAPPWYCSSALRSPELRT